MPVATSNGKPVLDTGSVLIFGETHLTTPFPKPIIFRFVEDGGAPHQAGSDEGGAVVMTLRNFTRQALGVGLASPVKLQNASTICWLFFKVYGHDQGPAGASLQWTLYGD